MVTFFRVIYTKILYKIPLKLLLVLLAIFWLLFACTKAWLVEIDRTTYSMWSYNDWHYTNSDADLNCLQLVNCSSQNAHWLAYNFDRWLHAQYLNWNHELANSYGSCTSWDIYFGTDWTTCSFQIASYVFDYYTSQQCQTEYNLIPVEDVTSNYCKLNFDLINPAECPINSGTGAIIWSNLSINNTPYAQNQNINVYIPDFLAWTISFNDYTTSIDVEWYNADTNYIENVINQEKLTPTNEDFAWMLTWLANLAPYLFITLLMFFFIRLINKIWK